MKNKYLRYTLISISALLVLIAIILFGRNLLLKKDLEKNKNYTSIADLEQRKDYISRNYPDVTIVHNGKEGIWDKSDTGKKLELIEDLSLHYEGKDTNKIFYHVTDVIPDNQGYIYVAQHTDGNIKKFDKSGNYVLTIGRKGCGPKEFLGPLETLIHNNILYVYDCGNNRISKFDINGNFLITINISGSLRASSFASDFIYDNVHKYFYITFYNNKTEKVIHKYSENGTYIHSFGDPVTMTKENKNFKDFTLKKAVSRGKLCLYDNNLFYTQNNPYEIRQYNGNHKLNMVIFRENTFMPPKAVEIIKNGIKTSVPAKSFLIRIWNGMIINCVYVPFKVSNKIGCVIDLFNLNGKLLTSCHLKKHLSFRSMDKEGFLYGKEIVGNFEDERIVRYKLKLK